MAANFKYHADDVCIVLFYWFQGKPLEDMPTTRIATDVRIDGSDFTLLENQRLSKGVYGSKSDHKADEDNSVLVKQVFQFRCYFHNEACNDDLRTFWREVLRI